MENYLFFQFHIFFLIIFFSGYGIATPKGSPWRDHLSLAILELQEKGTIQMLYNKWWKNTGDVCTRQVCVKSLIFLDTPVIFLNFFFHTGQK